MPIFFSLDPKTFGPHPRTCTIQNGTTIYSNHSIPQDCSCVAPIPADPDFAGAGVIASFCFLAWLTIFLATIPAFYSMRESWRRSKPPWKIFKFLVMILSTQVHKGNPRESAEVRSPRVVSPARTTFDGDIRLDEKFMDRRTPITLTPEPPVEPKPLQVAHALLQSLTDIQTFTGLAIIISAFAQYDRITFYHEQFAVNLWWLTLNSLWVSRIDYNEDSPLMGTWRIQARRLAILTSVLMSAALQLLVALRERDHWSPLNGKKCYIGSALGNNFGQNVFWFVGASIYALVLALGIFSVTRTWVDQRIFEQIPGSLAVLSTRMHRSYDEFRNGNQNRAVSFLEMVGNTVIYASWWAIVQFLSIWSAGNTSHALELIVYTVFAGSNTWWVLALKVDNVHLVQGNENRFTLGQTLPLMLTGLVGFAAFDAL